MKEKEFDETDESTTVREETALHYEKDTVEVTVDGDDSAMETTTEPIEREVTISKDTTLLVIEENSETDTKTVPVEDKDNVVTDIVITTETTDVKEVTEDEVITNDITTETVMEPNVETVTEDMKPDKMDDDMDDYVDITTGNYIIDITTTAVSNTDKDNKEVITTVGPIVQDEVIETTIPGDIMDTSDGKLGLYGLTLLSLKVFRKHMAEHMRTSHLYKCPHCGLRFDRKSQLRYHI